MGRWWGRLGGRWQGVAVVYVLVVVTLAVAAFPGPDAGFSWPLELGLFLLTLPVVLAAFPVVYVGGAAVWALSRADDGGPWWAVPVGYGLIFAGIAIANVWTVSALAEDRRRSRVLKLARAGS